MGTTDNVGADDESGAHGQIGRLGRQIHGSVPGGAVDPDQVLAAVTATTVEVIDAAEFDSCKTQHNQGHCLDAVWTSSTVRIDDITTNNRWAPTAGGRR